MSNTRNPVEELVKRSLLERAPGGSFQDRYELFEDWSAGRPILQADLDPSTINQAAVRLLTGASKRWKISGTNAANAGVALHAGGGISLATAGALNDQIILSPADAINSVGQSPWRVTQWQPQQECRFEAQIELPSIESVKVTAGFVLTDALDLTTDADQAKLLFNTAGAVSASTWTAAASIAGTDTETDSEVEALASKTIRLAVWANTDGEFEFLINGTVVHTTATATAAANLIPHLSIQALTAAAKTLIVRSVRVSRLLTAAS